MVLNALESGQRLKDVPSHALVIKIIPHSVTRENDLVVFRLPARPDPSPRMHHATSANMR